MVISNFYQGKYLLGFDSLILPSFNPENRSLVWVDQDETLDPWFHASHSQGSVCKDIDILNVLNKFQVPSVREPDQCCSVFVRNYIFYNKLLISEKTFRRWTIFLLLSSWTFLFRSREISCRPKPTCRNQQSTFSILFCLHASFVISDLKQWPLKI